MAGRVLAPLYFALLLLAGTPLEGGALDERSDGSKVVVMLQEACHQGFNVSLVEEMLAEDAEEWNVTEDGWRLEFSSVADLCVGELHTRMSALLRALASAETRALVASVEPALCETAALAASMTSRLLVTWSCPQLAPTPMFVNLPPSLASVASAVVAVVERMRWKNAAVLALDAGFWPTLAHSIDVHLRRRGVVVRHHMSINAATFSGDSADQILQALHSTPARVLVLCLPLGAAVTLSVVRALAALQLPATALLALHLAPTSPTSPTLATQRRLRRDRNDSGSPSNSTTPSTRRHSASLFERTFFDGIPPSTTPNLDDQLLVLAASDTDLDDVDPTNAVTKQLRRAMNTIRTKQNLTLSDSKTNQTFFNESLDRVTFVLVDCVGAETEASWRRVLRLEGREGAGFVVSDASGAGAVTQWARGRRRRGGDNQQVAEDCDSDDCDTLVTDSSETLTKSAQIATIVICSAVVAGSIIALGMLARRHILQKRMSKGPYKILLTPTDFVFPPVSDGLRVDEGMEAMLCCWLQQLQEFGGPEIDKPDVVKGSMGSLKQRNLVVHPKARYNGDLVQLKEIPTLGTFELKNKAMNVLVALHGLRHENVNPLLGVLVTSRPAALVLEWCSRGSLEDVLVQDEIKLDWSFRLSLLTDLVRGMRYLHSGPVRVHGNLTSRNCVIDARWVLKITDYGLPAFHEAQNSSPPTRTPRGRHGK